ncbi:MFS transporter [Phenylobacterium sp.]|uniref:MFS transporter n=1 Tax=Phenylobacterium sp. TaxID=1871053 RepID=UPI00301BE277
MRSAADRPAPRRLTVRDLAVLSALLMADILSTFELTMVYTAMPTISRAFDHASDVVWLVTAGLLVSATACALCGRLGDIYGRSRILLIVMGISCVGSFIAALATGLPQLIVGTALQGSAGAILPLALAIVRERFSTERVPLFVGILLSGSMVGAVAGLVIGGYLVDAIGWHSIYIVSGSFAATAILAVATVVGVRSDAAVGAQHTAMLRGVLFAPAIAMLLFAITKLREWGLADPRVLAPGLGAILIFVLWARHQLREEHPLIDLRLLRRRSMALPYLCICLLGLGAMQHTLVLSMFLQQPLATGAGLGLSATLAGYALVPVRIGGAVASPFGGSLVQKLGARTVLMLGAGLTGIGWLIIAAFQHSLPMIMVGMMLEGTAHIVIYVAASSAILQAAPNDRVGEAAGLGSVFRAAMVAVGTQFVAVLLATSSAAESGGAPSQMAYSYVFTYVAVTCGLIVLIAWFMPPSIQAAAISDSSTRKFKEPRAANSTQYADPRIEGS